MYVTFWEKWKVMYVYTSMELLKHDFDIHHNHLTNHD